MKKIFILSFFALGMVLATNAQEQALVSKKGTPYLPEQGEMALGMEATPFFSYLGNMFNDNTNNFAPTANFLTDNATMYAKYFLQEKRALRVKFGYASSNKIEKEYVNDDAAQALDPLSTAQVVDKKTSRNRTINLNLGYEFRKGKSRIQGFYGGELCLSLSTESQKFEYANPYSTLNPDPTVGFFNGQGGYISSGNRYLEKNLPSTYGIGANGFIGVEYFILPKFSLGAEMNWSIMFNKSGKSNNLIENFNGNETTELNRPQKAGSSAFTTRVNNPSAGIFMMFHF